MARFTVILVKDFEAGCDMYHVTADNQEQAEQKAIREHIEELGIPEGEEDTFQSELSARFIFRFGQLPPCGAICMEATDLFCAVLLRVFRPVGQ